MATKDTTAETLEAAAIGENAALLDFLRGGFFPQIQSIVRGDAKNGSILLLPRDMRSESVKKYFDEYLPAPERRKGFTEHTDQATFIDYVNRFSGDDCVIFASDSRDRPTMYAVFNHHPGGPEHERAGWGDHRAIYKFPVSEEWQAWHGKDGALMGQGEFAEFIEDRILDVVPPPSSMDGATGEVTLNMPTEARRFLAIAGGRCALPAEIMTLSRGLKIHADEKVERSVNLQSGENAMVYASEHRTTDGGKVDIPQMFLLQIPVFHGGPLYTLVARLRYRLADGRVRWAYQLHRADLVFDHAFKETVDTTRQATGRPVFMGSL